MHRDTLSAELAKQDWKEIHARLLKFCLNRGAPRAMAEDLVGQAIERVFAFDSEWDPERYPVLLIYLMGVVKMLLFKERRRAMRSESYDPHADDDGDGGHASHVEHADPRAMSEARTAETDLHERRLAALRARLAKRDDADALRVLELRFDGVETPAEVAEATGWPLAHANRARDRMQRAALEVAQDLAGDQDDEEVA